jgi:hypothetical protein
MILSLGHLIFFSKKKSNKIIKNPKIKIKIDFIYFMFDKYKRQDQQPMRLS